MIINEYIKRATQRWRDEMDDFRTQAIENQMKSSVSFLYNNFQTRETSKILEKIFGGHEALQPPILFKLPTYEELKEMIRQYCEIKRLF